MKNCTYINNTLKRGIFLTFADEIVMDYKQGFISRTIFDSINT